MAILDKLLSYKYGKLEYRSLNFSWKHFNANYVQDCVQINYPNEHDYTRTVEIKHVTKQKINGTTVCYEYPKGNGTPFYPIITKKNIELYQQYRLMAESCFTKRNVHFIGRLAEFKYYNMDQIFLKSLEVSKTIIKEVSNESIPRKISRKKSNYYHAHI